MRKHRRQVILIVVTTSAVSGGWFGYRVLYTIEGIPDAYAMWDTGLLVIDCMGTHERRWPRGWDDLRESWARLQPTGGSGGEHLRGGMTIEQLRSRVAVEWNVDAAKIVGSRERDIHVVRTLNETPHSGRAPTRTSWSGTIGRGITWWRLRRRKRWAASEHCLRGSSPMAGRSLSSRFRFWPTRPTCFAAPLRGDPFCS